MDYGKVADILTVIYKDGVELASLEYLPTDFFTELQDALELASFISGGWAEPTEVGKSQLEYAWRVLCDIRELDPEVMYESPLAFFEAQTVEAEVVPIEKGKKND
jgi:hypothetical protein